METLKNTIEFISSHLEGLSGLLSFILSCRIYFQMSNDKRQSSNEKRIEIYMGLSKEWDMIWAKITSFPQKNKEIFKKDISEIEDENLRLAISNAVHLLSRVFFYYKETNQEIKDSDWNKTCRYIFNKKLFFSIYKKHQNRYSKDFINYIEDVISADNQKTRDEKNVITIKMKKDLLIEKNRQTILNNKK